MLAVTPSECQGFYAPPKPKSIQRNIIIFQLFGHQSRRRASVTSSRPCIGIALGNITVQRG